MKKTAVVTVPLFTILLLLELASAKPIDSPENLKSQNALTKPVTGSTEQKIILAIPEDTAIKPLDSSDTVAFGSEKITDDLNSNKSDLLPLPPISGEEKNVIGNVKPGFEEPSRSPTSSELGPERPSGLVVPSKPDSSKTDSLITTLEPVSKGGDTFSSATSLKPGSKESDNLVTTLKPVSLSATPNGDSGEPDSSPTTSRSDSDRERRENSATTSMPSSHHHGNKLTNLPVTGETKNGASDIGSSCMMVLLCVFLITGSQVT